MKFMDKFGVVIAVCGIGGHSVTTWARRGGGGKGPSTYDVRFFQGFFDLPTYPCPILS